MDNWFISGLLAAVSVVFVDGDTSTDVVVCPFPDPLAHGVSCLQGGLSNLQYNTMGPAPGTAAAQRKRGAPVETITVERDPDVPPPSTVDLSTEFIAYFCSDHGRRMVECAREVYDKCMDHPSMNYLTFNPDQAARARALCADVKNDYDQIVNCLNETAKTETFLSCAYAAYEKYRRSYIADSCRATADVYNCYRTVGARFCGETTLDFSVALMRAMEEHHCTAAIDAAVMARTSTAVSVAPSIASLLILTLLFVSVLR